MQKNNKQVSTGIVLASLEKNSVKHFKTLSGINVSGISDAGEYTLASETVKELKNIRKVAETKRTEITIPLNAALAATNNLFKPFFNRIDEVEGQIKRLMIGYLNEMETLKARHGADFVNGDIKKVSTLLKKQAECENPVGAAQVRSIQTLEIKSVSKIPLKYLVPNEALILADLKNGIAIPGCKITILKSIAI